MQDEAAHKVDTALRAAVENADRWPERSYGLARDWECPFRAVLGMSLETTSDNL
jgi:hypothetical protein